jgi:hypothetical protein
VVCQGVSAASHREFTSTRPERGNNAYAPCSLSLALAVIKQYRDRVVFTFPSRASNIHAVPARELTS